MVGAPPPPRLTFATDGDEISGWWWLRDDAGAQKATWAFFALPAGDPIRLDLSLLATDTYNGGPNVPADFYLSYGSIVNGSAVSPSDGDLHAVHLRNTSPPGDPVGYTATGTYDIPASALVPGAIGLWVRIGRLGPTEPLIATHVAVRADSVSIEGLPPGGGGPGVTPGPDRTTSPGETPAPTATSLYGTLTITTSCQTWSSAPMLVTGSAVPDLHLEFSATADFAQVYANDDLFVLSPPAFTYDTVYGTDAFPNGIYVRYAGDHSVTAYATNKGYCAGYASPTPYVSPTPEPAATGGPPEGEATIVALGDSYISGEAGRWAGNTNDSYTNVDALGSDAYHDNTAGTAEVIGGCHRSESAEVHVEIGGYGPVTTINLACSGATTFTKVPGPGTVKPGIDLCPGEPDRDDCPSSGGVPVKGQATMLEEVARTHDVRMVALSIGGNDFSFSDTISDCATDFATSPDIWSDYCHDDDSVNARFSDARVAAVKSYLMRAYGDIVAAMQAADYPDDHWSLLVQDYPSPLPKSDGMRYSEFSMTRFNNGCPFWDEDADWANDTALPKINSTIAAAVEQFAAEHPSIDVHLMDISNAFVGHRLCEDTVDLVGPDRPVKTWTSSGASDGSEWVAQIRGVFSSGGKLPLPGSVYYKNESFHPNYWGQLALRDCLRQAYNNGLVRGGTCTFMQTGLNAFGEPTMILTQP